jgi:hypothetical protein
MSCRRRGDVVRDLPPASDASVLDVSSDISASGEARRELSDSPNRMIVAADTPPIVCRCSLGLLP